MIGEKDEKTEVKSYTKEEKEKMIKRNLKITNEIMN
jgi:hypothetical protein